MLSLEGQGEEPAGIGALGQAGENRQHFESRAPDRPGNLTCALPVALMREELVTGAYC